MDYNYENTGCGNLLRIQTLFGVALISILANVLFGNFLLVVPAFGLMALAYGEWGIFFLAIIGIIAYVLFLGSFIEILKHNLHQARQYKDYATKNYLAIFIVLLIPIILGAFFQAAHIGSFYSLMMLGWSYLVVNRNAITSSRQKSKNDL